MAEPFTEPYEQTKKSFVHSRESPMGSRFFMYGYGVASDSRIDKIIGLFCRISSLSQGSFAKETCNLSILLITATPQESLILCVFKGEPYGLSLPYVQIAEPYSLCSHRRSIMISDATNPFKDSQRESLCDFLCFNCFASLYMYKQKSLILCVVLFLVYSQESPSGSVI